MSDRNLPAGRGDQDDGDRGRPPAFRADPARRPPVEAWAWTADPYGRPEDEVGLDEVWAVLRRRWAWIAGAVLLALGAAAWWTWQQVPEWQASATLRVERQDRALGASSEQRLLLGRGASELETEMRVLETRPIREQVVARLGLPFRVVEPPGAARALLFENVATERSVPRARYRIERRGEDSWRLLPLPEEGGSETAGAPKTDPRDVAAGDTVRLAGAAFVLATDSALTAMGVEPPAVLVVETVPVQVAVAALGRGMTVTRPDPDASLLEVRYRGTDRYLVRGVTNALTDAFLERRREVGSTEARSTARFLEEQTARIRTQLEAAEEELQAFREREQVVAPEAQAEEQVGRLADMRARLQELESERDALDRLTASLEGEAPASVRRLATFPTFLRNQTAQTLFQSLTQARAERAAMLESRTESHPEVMALDRKIAELEEQLGDMGDNYLASLNDQIASLEARLARFGSEVEEIPAREVQFARLERRTEMLTELHTMLQQRLKEAEIREAVEDPSVRVVESAILPEEPVSPRPARNLMFAGFLGLVLGVGLALVREYTDRRIHDEEDVDRALGLPVLTRVPPVPRARDKYPRRDGLVAAGDGRSLPAESYRTLRTNVRYTRGGKGTRELVVTSPGARDGKSMTASNLAVAFAQQGRKTLLVDADMRRSVQHEAFEVERSPGLSDVLVEGDSAGALGRAVRATATEGLDLLPAGDPPPNPAELLDSEAMERLLERARERYDVVVIDTPPALAVTDASVLGTRVEGVLLVVRADQTDRQAAADAREQLERVGCDVLGVVFNEADGGAGGYRYDYYYRYYGDEADGRGAAGRLRKLLPFA